MSMEQPPVETGIRIATPFDVETVRRDFPVLETKVYGEPLVYLDNAASTQKPQVVIDRIADYYRNENSNIHRGVHFLSQQATEAYDRAREVIAAYINAPDPGQCIFTRGTTEGINLVASTFGRQRVREGDEVVVSVLEHHSNIVPWQLLCEEKGARLRVISVDETGQIEFEAYAALLNDRTRLVSIGHVSNALGTINPVQDVIREAHARGIPVVVDGAQAIQHTVVDVQALDCDFYCFSGHKMYGPMGVGILYGRRELLESMPPYQGGGDMIETVSFDRTTYNELPYKFEAGTPNVADGLGLGAAVSYMQGLGVERITAHEYELLRYATDRLSEIPGLRVVGTAPHKAAVVSFVLDGIHPYDAGTLLDRMGIAVRTGHHCAQPLMARYNLTGTIRASFGLYNTFREIDSLVEGVRRTVRMLA